MIKKLILVLAVMLPMSVFAQKFGVVDLDAIMQAMPETAAAQETINEASKKYETEFQKLQDELQKRYAEFQTIQDDPETPQTIKERRMQEIQTLAGNVDNFRQTASQDLQRQHEQLMAPIQQRLMEAIKAVGQDGGFTFIMPNESILLYTGSTVINVTNDVKAKLGVK
ncbi:MAG: OmpH family outer membrane protein [Muribaculaceae bacterium]|nr:OmpH family outer membrane protein [Muribaculaceae bacterium]